MRKRILVILSALAALAGAVFIYSNWPKSAVEIAETAPENIANNNHSNLASTANQASPQGASSTFQNATSAASHAGPWSPDEQARRLQQARSRYERAEQTYLSYRDATRYPHDSRPISEHPDRIRPFDAVSEDKTMRSERGEPVKGIQIRSSQSQVFLSGADSVKFTVQAFDEQGAALPLSISRAAAQTLADNRQLATPRSATLEFADNGAIGIDDQAADRIYSARLTPATQGFTGVNGTIRVLVFYKADGKDGVTHFDVIYTEETPATWVEGGIREALEQGSLNFYVKAQIKRAGRYVASVRVDDANGQPFALLSFNEELAAGMQEFKLNLFGALIRDKRPSFPLRLRDLDGFLLLADQFPDRLMLPRKSGVVHRSGMYKLENFSDAEWSSEERERYLNELGRDLDAARRALTQPVK